MLRLTRSVLAAVAVSSVLALGLSACGAGDNTTGGSGGKPSVVAAFYPLAWATEQVGGDDVTLTDLTTPGVEPHDLDLKVKQTAAVADADLVVYEKDFQPAVDSAVEENAKASFDVADAADLERRDDGLDPHFWQDPARMAKVVEALAQQLGEIDPEHEDGYDARAAAAVTKLTALDSSYRQGLASCRIERIVVSHDAFGYLGKYGLEVTGIAGLSPDAEPSAKKLAELRDLIRSDGITTVFSETLASPKLSEALARDLGIEAEVLDPIEGVAKDAPTGTDYLSLMRTNLETLREANSCS